MMKSSLPGRQSCIGSLHRWLDSCLHCRRLCGTGLHSPVFSHCKLHDIIAVSPAQQEEMHWNHPHCALKLSIAPHHSSGAISCILSPHCAVEGLGPVPGLVVTSAHTLWPLLPYQLPYMESCVLAECLCWPTAAVSSHLWGLDLIVLQKIGRASCRERV